MKPSLLAQVDIGNNLLDNSGAAVGPKYTSISPLISYLLKNSLTIAGIIFLGLLIFGGISLIINAGSSDSKKAAQAQQTVSSALIGFAVVFSAYFIIQIISLITGVKILDSGL